MLGSTASLGRLSLTLYPKYMEIYVPLGRSVRSAPAPPRPVQLANTTRTVELNQQLIALPAHLGFTVSVTTAPHQLGNAKAASIAQPAACLRQLNQQQLGITRPLALPSKSLAHPGPTRATTNKLPVRTARRENIAQTKA